MSIRSDHGSKFENQEFTCYNIEHDIGHNFSTLITPQQDGVIERKNRYLEEMAKTIINERPLLESF